ncbi:MAG: hypothetical protein JST54_29820 [Deltaproteobacteria bacterium]|nr:hypothetical protein [Deltaproteobacteria bacterium]
MPPVAVHVLGASDLPRARAIAQRELERASNCLSCSQVLKEVFERVGSTLFLDDSPELLAQAFPPAERDGFTARVLAAYIVLFGRERVPVPV